MKHSPPRWAERFLQWYCRPDLLEEIQGDLEEIFGRASAESPRKARLLFVWNVLRFFRWKNIRKSTSGNDNSLSPSMIRNILLVAFRNAQRQPTHSLISVLGLTAGFACAILIGLWCLHQFSYDAFHEKSDRIVKVITHVRAEGNVQTYDVAAAGIDLSSIPEVKNTAVIQQGARWPNELCFRPAGKPDECVYFNGVYSTPGIFDMFSFNIVQGSAHPLQGEREIAISEKMSRALYGDESALGKTISIDGWQEVTVVSVFADVPSNSSLKFDFVMPHFVVKKLWGVSDDQFNGNFFQVYAEMNDVPDLSAITAKLNGPAVLSDDYRAQQVSYESVALRDWHLNSQYENGVRAGGKIGYVKIFALIGALVVLMAMINFVNLTTARASIRSREIGVRKVHGAARRSIVFQFMVESFLTVFIAFSLAAALAYLAIPIFNSLIGEELSVRLIEPRVFIAIASILTITSFFAGIYPSIVYSSFQPARVLKGLFQPGLTGSVQVRKVLMAVQLCISAGVIMFTGVLFSQMDYITSKNLGYDKDNMIRVEPTWTLLKSYDRFREELLRSPAIATVGSSNANPIDVGGSNTSVSWSGKPDGSRIAFKTIGSMFDFPQAIGLKIIEGRGFLPERGGIDSIDTDVLVSQEAVRVMNLKQPLGEKIKIGDKNCTIVGVINDFHTTSLKESREPVVIYQVGIRQVSAIYVRYNSGEAQEALSAIQGAYKGIENSFSMRYWFQDDTFNELYKTEMIASSLTIGFSIIAFIIALVGIVGLAAFTVMRKTRELSIRRVFGASALQGFRVLAGEFAFVVAVAIGIALPVGWYFGNEWLTSFTYHVDNPWWIYAGVPCVMIALVLGLILLQGIRTLRSNPAEVLRSE